MFAGKKSAQIREILISESAWEEMTCLFAPSLDFAINQHVLPLIEGYGAGFKERLHNLEQKLVEFDLHISKATLRNIINNGDIYSESYSYF